MLTSAGFWQSGKDLIADVEAPHAFTYGCDHTGGIVADLIWEPEKVSYQLSS